MKAAGKRLDFAEASKATTFGTASEAPEAEVLRTRKTVLIEDAKGCELDGRYKACKEYGINQIVYVPVLGGVLEYGVSDTCKEQWKGLKDAHIDAVPKAELERAFRDGATYAIYWRKTGDKFDVVATFETKNQRTNAAAAQSKDSYVQTSKGLQLDVSGKGPIGNAASSGTTVVVPNTANCANFKRSELAQKWGIGSITCVPTADGGVLEYGRVTADRRGTTVGAEYQEASRTYRRTVFNGPDWPEHRSTDRFFKSLRTLLQSGVLRARARRATPTSTASSRRRSSATCRRSRCRSPSSPSPRPHSACSSSSATTRAARARAR